jgi:D-alanine-D-alanine ligase
VQDRALAAYRSLGCEGYARIDFIMPPGGVTGDAEPVFLEANTLPGFTSRSLLPRAAAATGVDFRGLCLELCARALLRFEDLPL